MEAAGIVLVGGRSSRMGTPKAALEWHGSTLLYRTAALLARTLSGPVVVVAAPDQPLPRLPIDVQVAHDPVEGRGPLQGIAVGLAAVTGRAPVAFVASTDLPFLHPAFVLRVLRTLDCRDVDVALPVALGHRQPLAAGYRTDLAGPTAELLAGGGTRPGQLFERCRVRALDEAALLADADLARLDPDLDSVQNVNEPAAYAAARTRPAPTVGVECYGALARAGRPRRTSVRAATLAAAAAAASVELDPYVSAALNGDRISRDPELPLVAGDTVAFISADAGG